MLADTGGNPYVGPRPFERGDRGVFFGRDAEVRELLSLVVAERVVLLYAASGAGKTSLLHAGLVPLLEEEEGFEVLPVARIQAGLAGDALDRARNVYTLGVLSSVAADEAVAGQIETITPSDFLAARPHTADAQGFATPRALIIDQFEELFTAFPRYWRQRERFVRELAEALEHDPMLRVVLAIREDYVAQLDSYEDALPRGLRARFRLERLGPEEAVDAVVRPTLPTRRHYAEGVAEKLVADLLRFRTDTGHGATIEIEGEYVEPVQLQVACQSLWGELPASITEITVDHLRTFGDVDEVLRRFYDHAVHAAASAAHMRESRLRSLLEHWLITAVGTRNTVYRREDSTGGIPNPAIDELENRHVIRAEWRAGARWYELTHDRLIGPIQSSNERFRSLLTRRWRRGAAVGVTAVAVASVVSAWAFWPSRSPESPDIGLSVESMTLNVPGSTFGVEGTTALGNGYRVSLEPKMLPGRQARVFASLVDRRTGAVVAGPVGTSVDLRHDQSRISFQVWMRSPRRAGQFQLTLFARSTGGKADLTGVSPTFTVRRTGALATPSRTSAALTIEADGAGTVTVMLTTNSTVQTCPPECSFVYSAPASVKLTPQPARGWQFARWSSGCHGVSASCTITVSRRTTVNAFFTPVPRRSTLGSTTKGTPITAVALGDPRAKRKVLVVACVRPSECQGRRIADALLKKTPPRDVELLIIRNLNPDGVGDLGIPGRSPNRAFPCYGLPETLYSRDCRGHRRPLTKEASVAYDLILRKRPVLTIWYLARTPVDANTTQRQKELKAKYPAWVNRVGNARAIAVERRFAKLVGLSLEGGDLPLEPKGGYPASPTYWHAHRFPNDVAFWVELPSGPLSRADAERHANAILTVTRGL